MPGKASTAERAELIDALRELALRLDKESPRIVDMRREDDLWSYSPYANEFDSWDDALRAAGLTPTSPTKDEVISDIRQLSEQLGYTPSSYDYHKYGKWDRKVVARRFDGWKNAVKAAGLTPRTTQIHEYTPDEALAALERVDGKFDRQLQVQDLNEDPDAPTHKTLAKLFGSVDNAVRRSNVEVFKFHNPTDKEVLEDIRRESDDGKPPFSHEYMGADGGLYSLNATVRERFGSWERAVSEAGLTPRRNSTGEIPSSRLISELKSVGEEIDGIPRYNEIGDIGEYSATAYENQFGSWLNALNKAGYPVEQRLGKARPPITLNERELDTFVDTLNSLHSQLQRLTCLFLLFMGTSPKTYSNMTEKWLKRPLDSNDLFIDIPESSPYGSRMLEVPNTWNNPMTGNEEVHHLKDLIEWYFEEDYTDSVGLHKMSPTVQIHHVASKADIEWQNTVTVSGGRRYPDLQARDLRETHGVHLARNGAPKWQIQRRLGLDSEEDAQHYIEQAK